MIDVATVHKANDIIQRIGKYLEPLLQNDLPDVCDSLTQIGEAKLHSALSYTINSLARVHFRSQGQEPPRSVLQQTDQIKAKINGLKNKSSVKIVSEDTKIELTTIGRGK
eukprot:UN07698